ncbi:hypothetical protein [Bacillus alkalicellulosilyticus]|uniref:hypothetical protein n=1 Tax=Alkalihalobacterium alkalicellulosilyticum TaxID=1912214 RepID=UPI0009981604|nr:hypothetical protein [Bacillus alkalicellulosilyticus]
MKKIQRMTIYTAIVLSGLILSLFLILNPSNSRETLVLFPADPHVEYMDASSSLLVVTLEDEDEYVMEWKTKSKLDRTAYLRHDVSLLFEDGQLKDSMIAWKDKTDTIEQKRKVQGEDSGYYQVISFHHSEIHYPNEEITSKQMMSTDDLYVIDSPLTPLTSFKVPESDKQLESKKLLDNIIDQQLKYTWEDLLIYYNIRAENYELIPLTRLAHYQETPFPGFSEENTDHIIGFIWETLYENYVLGIKQEDGSVKSPIDSSVPLILLAKDKQHFVIVFQTSDGQKVQILKSLSIQEF